MVGLELQTQTGATVTLGADGTPLLELERDTDAGSRGNRAGLSHTAFRVPSRMALGAALERIRDGWRLDGASDHNVSEALSLAAGGYHHHVGVNTWNGRSDPAGGRGLAWFEVTDPDGIRLRIRAER